MKRRNIILTFAIIALLLIGVGYAALTDTLTIGGTVNTTVAPFEVEFFSATTVTENNGSTAKISDDKHTLTLEVKGLQNAGQTVTFEVKISNPSTEFAAELNSIALELEGEQAGNFEISNTFAAQTGDDALAGNNAEQYAFTITVTLKTVPNTEEGFSANITGTISASAKAN